MGKQDIIDVLKKRKEYLSSKEISKLTGIGINSTGRALKVMRNNCEIKWKYISSYPNKLMVYQIK